MPWIIGCRRIVIMPCARVTERAVTITRETARQVATAYLAAPPNWSGWPILKVVSYEEVANTPPQLYLYGTDQQWRLEDCWIVYLEPASTLRSDTVLLISKKDGTVVFFGSAGDDR